MEDYDTRCNPRCECLEGIIVAPGIVKIEFVDSHQPVKQQPFPNEPPLVVDCTTNGHILLFRIAQQSSYNPRRIGFSRIQFRSCRSRAGGEARRIGTSEGPEQQSDDEEDDEFCSARQR